MDITGDVDGSDISHTQLAVKHPIDQRFPNVPGGNFVVYLSGEEYYSLPGPLRMVPLTLDKFFIQIVEQGETPIRARNVEEMEEAGGTLDPHKPELLPFRPAADIFALGGGFRPEKIGRRAFCGCPGSGLCTDEFPGPKVRLRPYRQSAPVVVCH